MNERIEKLTIEANNQTGNEFDLNHKPLDDFLKKFAELIVRECAGVVKNLSPGYDDYRNQIEDAFRIDCVEQLKQHFGVEE